MASRGSSNSHVGRIRQHDDPLLADAPRATRFNVGAEELVVFSFPLRAVCLPEALSPVERDVTLAILEGLSNAAIAARRRTSERTVANQMASIFRKLDVSSRRELLTRLTSGAAADE
jgi:DNA-binding NarL/FixJ family response regulator